MQASEIDNAAVLGVLAIEIRRIVDRLKTGPGIPRACEKVGALRSGKIASIRVVICGNNKQRPKLAVDADQVATRTRIYAERDPQALHNSRHRLRVPSTQGLRVRIDAAQNPVVSTSLP